MTPAFLQALEQQPWKGNIRELRNVIERSLIVCEGGRLDVCDLPLEIQNTHYECSDDSMGSFELAAMERRHIARVLEYTKGNKTEAARLLKIGLTTLYRKIEEYKIWQSGMSGLKSGSKLVLKEMGGQQTDKSVFIRGMYR